ncbi:MAG TPA: hypothetical protein EYQ25_04160 [Planctomycetes bacterium]|nr:hypothetical protein [Planctomycetota bacterium]
MHYPLFGTVRIAVDGCQEVFHPCAGRKATREVQCRDQAIRLASSVRGVSVHNCLDDRVQTLPLRRIARVILSAIHDAVLGLALKQGIPHKLSNHLSKVIVLMLQHTLLHLRIRRRFQPIVRGNPVLAIGNILGEHGCSFS